MQIHKYQTGAFVMNRTHTDSKYRQNTRFDQQSTEKTTMKVTSMNIEKTTPIKMVANKPFSYNSKLQVLGKPAQNPYFSVLRHQPVN